MREDLSAAGGNVGIGFGSTYLVGVSATCVATGPACPFIAGGAGILATIGFDKIAKPWIFERVPGFQPIDSLEPY